MLKLALTRRVLHWVVAVLVILMVPAGLIFTDFDNKPTIEGVFGEGSFDTFYNLHKSTGALVLALVMVRILGALLWPAPPHQAIPGAQSVLARASHGAMYSLLVITPLLGWAGVSSYPAPLPVFGFFDLPTIVQPNRPVAEFLLQLHGASALTLIALAALHVAAAFYHRNVRKDGIFARIALW
jgi:cytochrome b561